MKISLYSLYNVEYLYSYAMDSYKILYNDIIKNIFNSLLKLTDIISKLLTLCQASITLS